MLDHSDRGVLRLVGGHSWRKLEKVEDLDLSLKKLEHRTPAALFRRFESMQCHPRPMPLSAQWLVESDLRSLLVSTTSMLVELVALGRLLVHFFRELLHQFLNFIDTHSPADLLCFIVSTQFAPFVSFSFQRTLVCKATSLWGSS